MLGLAAQFLCKMRRSMASSWRDNTAVQCTCTTNQHTELSLQPENAPVAHPHASSSSTLTCSRRVSRLDVLGLGTLEL